jgi:type II secretory pathway pseudopilin PulG
VALLEAMLALAILATAATALVSLTAASAAAVRQAREGETEVRAAHAFLEAVALWSRADLDRHLGDRTQHPWRLVVSRPARTLYVVVLTDSTGHRELVRSALYRPEAARAAAFGVTGAGSGLEEVLRAR